MSSIQDYKKRVSGNVKNAMANNTIQLYSTNLKNSPTYYEVNINNVAVGVSITDDSDTIDQKNIVSLYEIQNGDYFMWQNSYWIISHMDNMHGVYFSGKIRQCPSSIKWLNSDGIVKEAYFAFASTQQSNFGVQDGRIISLGNERRQIMIQSNADTQELSKGKRFIFDGRAWKCTAHDSISKQGTIVMTLEEDTINPADDNVDLRIADYYGNVANFTIQILNGESFSMRAGTTLQLHTEVRNNGVVVDKAVVYESSNPAIASVSSSGLVSATANGNVLITAKIADMPSVNDTTSVTIQLETVHNYSIELDSSPTIILNQSKTFTAIVKDNMVTDPTKTVMWYVYAQDGVSPTDVVSVTMNSTTQITLKGNTLGYCKVKAVLIGSNPQVVGWFNVQVKSLI